MTNSDLIQIGFQEIPHMTIGNSVIYQLGRNLQLSASSVGTPNEVLYICEVDDDEKPTKITDLVCLHNYDYDGQLTRQKVQKIIEVLTNGKN